LSRLSGKRRQGPMEEPVCVDSGATAYLRRLANATDYWSQLKVLKRWQFGPVIEALIQASHVPSYRPALWAFSIQTSSRDTLNPIIWTTGTSWTRGRSVPALNPPPSGNLQATSKFDVKTLAHSSMNMVHIYLHKSHQN
jgi:hypothetical protein